MKLVFFRMSDTRKKYLSEKLARFNPVFVEQEISLKNSTKARDANAIGLNIYSTVNQEILGQLPNLKFITTVSTGFDHIDLDTCKKKGIQVSNVPKYGVNTVAEHTFALILALSRKIMESAERTKHGDFVPTGLEGFDLKGKILGVVGTGKIGVNVIKIAYGFGMKVIAHDIF